MTTAPLPLETLAGWEVVGRHGPLGTVVESPDGTTVTVAAGVSELLRFHVPGDRIRSLAPRTETVVVDLDVADFVPSRTDDGLIDLHLRSRMQ